MIRLARMSLACLLFSAAPGIAHSQTPNLPGHVADIKVGEYFILAPDSVPTGLVTLRLTQTGDVVKPWPADMAKLRADQTYHFHMIWLVRLDSAKTIADLLEAEERKLPAPWAKIVGGPGFADAPNSSNVSMILAPGKYALVCYVGSAREDRNRYHLLKGMVRPITVTGRSSSARLPAPGLTIVIRGDSVKMPDTLVAGAYRVLLRNKGEKATDFGISRLKPGYTIQQAKAWRAHMMTEPPRHAVGGVVWIAPDSARMTSIELKPGDYFFEREHVVIRKRRNP